jgi:hypothetical protein
MNEVERYLRAAALKRGMDPDAIVRVAKTEGGLSDPFQQSNVVKNGRRERSYGPLQLYIDGGLGNEAIKAGIDPRTNWQGGIDFGLDHAAKKGWGEWYGPQNAGLPLDYGLKGARPIGVSLASMPADGPKGMEAYPRMAPDLPPPYSVADRPIGDAMPAQFDAGGGDMFAALKGLIGGENPDGTANGGFADIIGAFGGGSSGSSAPQIQPSQLGPSVGNEIAAKSASAQAMMSQLLEAKRAKTKPRRLPGISLMG